MRCAECESTKLKTYDTRQIGDYVVRKRRCEDCGDKFYTIETYMSEEQLAEVEAIRLGRE